MLTQTNLLTETSYQNMPFDGVDAIAFDMQQEQTLRNRTRTPKLDPADTESAALAILRVLGL